MFRKNYTVTINLPGGIVAAGDLYAIVMAAEQAKVTHIQPGNRQQLFCKVKDQYGSAFLAALDQAGVVYEVNDEKYPNIVSSYVTEGIFERGGPGGRSAAGSSGWLSEGLYKDILDGFDFRPLLKINLVESHQSFVPYFTGNINFISSGIGNYWHCYLRFPRTTRVHAWKNLVYSQDIPRISRLIEEAVLKKSENGINNPASALDELYEAIGPGMDLTGLPVTEALQMPLFSLPYYEGFNRYGNKTWLGIYRRDESFSLPFLKDICLICLQTRIGQLYTSPWRSLIIKGIEEGDRGLWEYVLGKYRINVRHASSELSWQIEDCSEEGLRLKRYLVRQLDQDDTRTDGLCFAIKTRPGTGLAGSVIIRKQDEVAGRRKGADRYDILHTPDFNANSKEYILYREGLEKEELSVYLISLCKDFYEQQSRKEPSPLRLNDGAGVHGPGGRAAQDQPRQEVFQCRHCLTVYDPEYGDPAGGLAPGTPFAGAGRDYECPVCGGDAAGFAAIEKTTLIHG